MSRKVETWPGRPINPQTMSAVESGARLLAKELDRILEESSLGEKLGFTLFVFPFEGPEFTYISNADRSTMIATVEEWLALQKSGQRGAAHGVLSSGGGPN